MGANRTFVEVDYCQSSKNQQSVAGDIFLSHRIPDQERTICILADGLGSGIKANVLATLTATMTMRYILDDIDIRRASEIIMSTLPVCKERKIGYSTFTILDIKHDGMVNMIEYDNPPCVLMRGQRRLDVQKNRVTVKSDNIGVRDIWHSRFRAKENDRAVLFSDGVTQSGMGTATMPLGWTDEKAAQHIAEICTRFPDISARDLSRNIVAVARKNDEFHNKDDITCSVIYFRRPRKTLIVTGPPIDKQRDVRLAAIVREFPGKKIVCGGTTATLIARELNDTISVNLDGYYFDVPPASKMEHVDLVTEGILTLTRCVDILEKKLAPETLPNDAAVQLVKILLDSDIIQFVVGTKINDAHQDPNLPVELDIRRNLIKRFVALLNDKYLKEASFKLI